MDEQPKELTIEILMGHCLGGIGNDAYPGRVLEAPKDLSVEDALRKVRIGYARVLAKKPGPEPSTQQAVSGPDVVMQRDPVVENRDPVIQATPVEEPHRGRPGKAGGRKSE